MRSLLCLAPESESLAVVVRGLGSSLFIRDVLEAGSAALPRADILVPSFDSRLWSNRSAASVALQLAATIDQIVKRRADQGPSYDAITLIGHSIGAALIRGACLIALGRGFREGPSGRRHAWIDRVDRIVALADLSEGWSLSDTGRVGRLESRVLRVMAGIARSCGAARFVLSVKAGAPYIAWLRREWLAVRASGERMPLVVQLRGKDDWVVAAQVGLDPAAGSRYIELIDTGHFDIGVFTRKTGQQISARIERNSLGNCLFRHLMNRHGAEEGVREKRRSEFLSALRAG